MSSPGDGARSRRRVVAVIPFGARGREGRAGIVGRQLARRLVERFATHPQLELRPVFLVAMAETKSDAGYLVFGSTPDTALAARYGASLEAAYALTGLYREDGTRRTLEVRVVDVARAVLAAERTLDIEPGGLWRAESDLAEWLAGALGAAAPAPAAPAATEAGYLALLGGMDAEVNATLLRAGDPTRSAQELARAQTAYLTALRADAENEAAEERLLVLAAESVERGDEARSLHALEGLIEIRPRAWRAHYLLGVLRRQTGDHSGAMLAFEHAHALHPLRDEDLVTLGELYLAAGASPRATAHLRGIGPGSAAYGRAQELLGVIAVGAGDLEGGRAALERAVAANAPASARLHLARVLIASGRREEARRALGAILDRGDDAVVVAQARRLWLGLERPDLEEALERAGRAALGADPAALASARADFERVVAHDEALWEAHFGLGLVARQLENNALATRELRRALELWPEQPDVLHELGVALLAGGETADALAALDRAASLRPNDAPYLADAGFAHLRAGDLGAARERLQLASGIDANDPLTRAYLAELERVESATGKAS